MKIRVIFSVFFIFLSLSINSKIHNEYATPANTKNKTKIPTNVDRYIKRFLKTAKAESKKYNIPVSISLAQGILESNSGKSTLSKKYNNHFGMKWAGKGKYACFRDDSPRDRFQVYETAWESWRHRSELLAKNPRYKHLIKLNKLQYKKWAYGLKRAGYATSERYAESLIKIIETYQLWKYDVMK